MLKQDVRKELSKHTPSKLITVVADNQIYRAPASCIVLREDSMEFDWIVVNYDDLSYIGESKLIDKVWPEWGSDPEFFFTKDNKIVPSKKIIPPYAEDVVRDGFQGELNPETNTCRQVAGNKVYLALEEAYGYARKRGAEVSLSVGVDVDKDTFYELPASERRFGCSPTQNPHENTKRISGVRTRFRSGGGHIHMGSRKLLSYYEEDATKIISLMDIVCGLGTVLLDRDEANIKRRKHYGRAGEHRLKRYGIEYRVPSNFWLKHYTLWSAVTVMLRNAINLFKEDEICDEIFKTIKISDVRKAINNNDKDLALKLYKDYASIIKKHKVTFAGGFGFHNIDLFLDWASMTDPVSMLDVDSFDDSLAVWEAHYEYEEVPGVESFLLDNFGNGHNDFD